MSDEQKGPQPPAEAQAVGEAEVMPGTNGGFTAAVFKSVDVPAGTKLYTAPPSAPVGVEGLPAKWRAEADEIAANNWSCNSNSIRARADELERVLAQQPAAECSSFTAGDMADAAAQGFRDGVASVGAAAVDEAMVARFLEAYRDTPGDEAIDADEKVARRWLTAALAGQRGGES